MAKIKILIEGYVSKDSPEEGSCSTITLIKDENITMVVDPGTMKGQELLVEKLKEENLTIDDVDLVCVTHSHMDHYRNIGMFPKAKALDYWGLWHGDKIEEFKEKFTDDIQILKTPGHSYDGITLFVKTAEGIIAVCGDVFWKENYPEDDQYATDKEKLKESREKILKMADFVIPGHGKMFKVKRL